ncbi:MAG: cbb3-type cytochrome c oxidase subunit 3 [Parasphingopyxis sp.]|uniref:cbb3-type cytochrome c oxidase subunit 3 n=1 Tax=Parasphingopyxis sp. TaxID=1920299 RepID=UPI00262C636D|nr:cbb3-type cytochrome c oxidase subunit 3 [uncultured Parasphingopyxis sp.]
MSYEEFRHFADSWGLLFMALTWLGFAVWAFRPSARKHHRDAANMIFEDRPDEGQDDER